MCVVVLVHSVSDPGFFRLKYRGEGEPSIVLNLARDPQSQRQVRNNSVH